MQWNSAGGEKAWNPDRGLRLICLSRMKVISNVENAQSRNGVWPRSVCMMGKSSHFLLCIMCGDWVHKNCRGMTSSHTIVNHLIQCVQ